MPARARAIHLGAIAEFVHVKAVLPGREARQLGLDVKTIRNKLKAYKIED
jgi:hypothetical protein